METINWDDVRYLLAVGDAGSFAQAGRQLRVEHTTVARRIARLERVASARLVSRTREGVVLTAAGAAMIGHLRRIEEQLESALRQAAAFDLAIEGTIRIATSEMFATGFLCDRLPDLQRQYPHLRTELQVGTGSVNLARREADIAVRLMPEDRRPSDPELVARKAGTIAFSLYGSRTYLAERPIPSGPVESLAGHRLLHFNDSAPRAVGSEWLRERDRGCEYVLRTNAIPVLLAAAQSGLGLTVLPTFVADRHPELVRLTDALGRSTIWILAHPDARKIRRVATAYGWLVETVQTQFRHGAGHRSR